MKKYLIGILIGLITSSLGIFVYQNFIIQILTYADLEIITKLLTGVAPFIAAFGAYYMWQTNRDYKNDHYEKIIDKRLNAYEKLCTFIGELDVEKRMLIHGKDTKLDDGKPYLQCFDTNEELHISLKTCLSLNKYRYWFSNTVKMHLDNINKIIAECCTDLNAPTGSAFRSKYIDKDSNSLDSISVGCSCFENMHKEIHLINIVISNDYKRIDDVKLFLDNVSSKPENDRSE
ncbi:hypothetical protein [Pectinatus cerevisiiphilus]|uniref:Uncharacterized protein n=1 Tax=Pectinatus cerevisiiphilus TaxID=86956 RepID=A0A4R3K2G3_9FIRM|nr:hypothetical protein [Pectinatus cerevisiiphilus]TCS76436.1 hypothetical protein EDC37_1227 [Pectinatus cerevisiiphilus]